MFIIIKFIKTFYNHITSIICSFKQELKYWNNVAKFIYTTQFFSTTHA